MMAKDMPLVINGAENNFSGNPEWSCLGGRKAGEKDHSGHATDCRKMPQAAGPFRPATSFLAVAFGEGVGGA